MEEVNKRATEEAERVKDWFIEELTALRRAVHLQMSSEEGKSVVYA